jgi:hypothetical protein
VKRVGRLEGDLYLFIIEPICDFVYQRAIEGESDLIFALRGRRDSWYILLFLKNFFVVYVIVELESIIIGNIEDHFQF